MCDGSPSGVRTSRGDDAHPEDDAVGTHDAQVHALGVGLAAQQPGVALQHLGQVVGVHEVGERAGLGQQVAELEECGELGVGGEHAAIQGHDGHAHRRVVGHGEAQVDPRRADRGDACRVGRACGRSTVSAAARASANPARGGREPRSCGGRRRRLARRGRRPRRRATAPGWRPARRPRAGGRTAPTRRPPRRAPARRTARTARCAAHRRACAGSSRVGARPRQARAWRPRARGPPAPTAARAAAARPDLPRHAGAPGPPGKVATPLPVRGASDRAVRSSRHLPSPPRLRPVLTSRSVRRAVSLRHHKECHPSVRRQRRSFRSRQRE
jgi:hypothetical protein